MQKVDVNLSKRIIANVNKGERNVMKNQAPIPGLEQTGTLFYYKRKFYFVNGKQLTKPLEHEVDAMLKIENKIKVYFICSDKICPMPKILVDKKAQQVKVKDDQGALNLMTRKSGILITIKNL